MALWARDRNGRDDWDNLQAEQNDMFSMSVLPTRSVKGKRYINPGNARSIVGERLQ